MNYSNRMLARKAEDYFRSNEGIPCFIYQETDSYLLAYLYKSHEFAVYPRQDGDDYKRRPELGSFYYVLLEKGEMAVRINDTDEICEKVIVAFKFMNFLNRFQRNGNVADMIVLTVCKQRLYSNELSTFYYHHHVVHKIFDIHRLLDDKESCEVYSFLKCKKLSDGKYYLTPCSLLTPPNGYSFESPVINGLIYKQDQNYFYVTTFRNILYKIDRSKWKNHLLGKWILAFVPSDETQNSMLNNFVMYECHLKTIRIDENNIVVITVLKHRNTDQDHRLYSHMIGAVIDECKCENPNQLQLAAVYIRYVDSQFSYHMVKYYNYSSILMSNRKVDLDLFFVRSKGEIVEMIRNIEGKQTVDKNMEKCFFYKRNEQEMLAFIVDSTLTAVLDIQNLKEIPEMGTFYNMNLKYCDKYRKTYNSVYSVVDFWPSENDSFDCMLQPNGELYIKTKAFVGTYSDNYGCRILLNNRFGKMFDRNDRFLSTGERRIVEFWFKIRNDTGHLYRNLIVPIEKEEELKMGNTLGQQH